MDFHPVADLFPLMSDEEFGAFCADIKANGLREDIWTHDGKIIDGRNRFNACLATGVEPRFREWDGVGQLLAFVVSLNLNRRHLNESQRAMVAQKLATMREGRPADADTANKTTQICGVISQTEAAEMLSVSPRLVSSARKVAEDGVPELAKKVESGEMSVSSAARIAALPKGKQKRIIRRGRKAAQRLIDKFKTKVLTESARSGAGCPACKPAEDTDENFLAAVEFLGLRFPIHERYLADIVEELAQEKLSDDTRRQYDLVLDAIDSGFMEKTDIHRATKITSYELENTLAVMVDYDMIEPVRQGGKTAAARGASKIMYIRKEKPETSVPESRELTYDLDDDDDLDHCAPGYKYPAAALRIAG